MAAYVLHTIVVHVSLAIEAATVSVPDVARGVVMAEFVTEVENVIVHTGFMASIVKKVSLNANKIYCKFQMSNIAQIFVYQYIFSFFFISQNPSFLPINSSVEIFLVTCLKNSQY